jgi:hypothetical protein
VGACSCPLAVTAAGCCCAHLPYPPHRCPLRGFPSRPLPRRFCL